MSSTPPFDDEPTPEGDWTTTATLITHDAQSSEVRKRSRAFIALIVGSCVFSVLGLLFLGAALGQLWWPQQQPEPIVFEAQSEVWTPELEEEQALPMPNLFGLDEESVTLVLADHDLGDVTISRRRTPSPGEAGLVLEQNPAPGTPADKVTAIELVVSEPMQTPDYRGKKVDDVLAELDKLGVSVIIKKTVTGSDDPGTVLGSTPEAGQMMPIEVELQIADPGQSIFVYNTNTHQLNSSHCSLSGSYTKAGGQKMEMYAACESGRDETQLNLTPGRKVALLSFDAAISDNSRGNNSHITILGDGKVLHEFDLARGQIIPVTLRIPDVFDLNIKVTGSERTSTIFGSIRYSVDPSKLSDLQ